MNVMVLIHAPEYPNGVYHYVMTIKSKGNLGKEVETENHIFFDGENEVPCKVNPYFWL